MAIAAEVAGFEATLRSLDKNPGEPMLEHFFVGCTTGANKVLQVVGLRRAALARGNLPQDAIWARMYRPHIRVCLGVVGKQKARSAVSGPCSWVGLWCGSTRLSSRVQTLLFLAREREEAEGTRCRNTVSAREAH